MKYYKYILKFDDKNHTLNAENGILAKDFVRIIGELQKSISGDFTISHIISSSYAIELSTENAITHEAIATIHKKIADNDVLGLSKEQKKYVETINDFLSKNPDIDFFAQNSSKQENSISIHRVELPQVDYYYQISSLYGIITGIGGKTLDGKSTIHIAEVPYEIEISTSQERNLLPYHKKAKILFTIQKKIDFNTSKVKNAFLENFEIITEDYKNQKEGFFEKIKNIRESYEDFFEEYIENEENTKNEL
jgi:hypothetical protein